MPIRTNADPVPGLVPPHGRSIPVGRPEPCTPGGMKKRRETCKSLPAL